MGISEPVLEEEGSLIAGWRAKFGEENHQVIVVGVLVVVGVIFVVVDYAATKMLLLLLLFLRPVWRGEPTYRVVIVTIIVVEIVISHIMAISNNNINQFYRRTVLCLTSLWEQAGLVASSMVSIGGHFRVF